MGRASWIDQANGGSNDEPPRSGRGATTAAWRTFAEARGYTVPKGAGRDAIIELVDAGPPAGAAEAPRSGRVEGPVYSDALASVTAARDAGHLTAADNGAVAVLLDLARTIDGMDDRRRARDNVTIPVYLKYLEALALTPASRARLPKTGGDSGSKLSKLRGDPKIRLLQGGAA